MAQFWVHSPSLSPPDGADVLMFYFNRDPGVVLSCERGARDMPHSPPTVPSSPVHITQMCILPASTSPMPHTPLKAGVVIWPLSTIA